VELSGRLDLKFTVQEPVGHKDWNEQLTRRDLTLFFPTAPRFLLSREFSIRTLRI
jgi:hypothetical protein